MLATSWLETVPNFSGLFARDWAMRQSLSNSSRAPLPMRPATAGTRQALDTSPSNVPGGCS